MQPDTCYCGGGNWDRLSLYLLFKYREVPQASTGFTPFDLLYGRQVRGPLKLLKDYLSKSNIKLTAGRCILGPDVIPLLELKLFRETLVQHTIQLNKDAPRKQRSYSVPEQLVVE